MWQSSSTPNVHYRLLETYSWAREMLNLINDRNARRAKPNNRAQSLWYVWHHAESRSEIAEMMRFARFELPACFHVSKRAYITSFQAVWRTCLAFWCNPPYARQVWPEDVCTEVVEATRRSPMSSCHGCSVKRHTSCNSIFTGARCKIAVCLTTSNVTATCMNFWSPWSLPPPPLRLSLCFFTCGSLSWKLVSYVTRVAKNQTLSL